MNGGMSDLCLFISKQTNKCQLSDQKLQKHKKEENQPFLKESLFFLFLDTSSSKSVHVLIKQVNHFKFLFF